MNTFIIESKEINLALEEIRKIQRNEKINELDIEIIEFEKSLGIDDIRNIQKKIFLKPLKGEKKSTILILKNSATIEAQNAMLKLLEEPPSSSFIFLILNNSKILLPTVLSRAKIIKIKNEPTANEFKNIEEVLSYKSIGEKLYLAQDLSKDKSEAISWIEAAILYIREVMLKNLKNKQEALRLRKLIHALELTHYDLKNTNANTRLVLENLFLSI